MVQELLPAVQSGERTLLCRKAWTAYIGLILLTLLFLLVGFVMIHESGGMGPLQTIGIIEMGLVLVVAGYRWFTLRTIVLYYNEQGVWEYSGVLPWNRGVRGVKWRDLEQCTFNTGFFSWLFRSYTIRLGHRFTRSNEVLIAQMAGARAASIAVNERLAEMARNHQLG